MNERKTAKEMLTYYVETMGQELGELFKATSDELSRLHWRWGLLRWKLEADPDLFCNFPSECRDANYSLRSTRFYRE